VVFDSTHRIFFSRMLQVQEYSKRSRKIEQKLVNWQAMQIPYITVLQFAMALHNYTSKVRNATNFSHANRNYCFQI